MAKSKRPPQSNSYDDDDMKALLDVLDEKDAEALEIMASAMGKVAGIRKWQKAEIKRAKDDLGIPTGVLKPLRKMRALEKQMRKVADEVADDLVEVFEDAVGQFSFFAPNDDGVHPASGAAVNAEETAAQAAARQRAAAVAEVTEREQAEGEAVLDELAGEAVH